MCFSIDSIYFFTRLSTVYCSSSSCLLQYAPVLLAPPPPLKSGAWRPASLPTDGGKYCSAV